MMAIAQNPWPAMLQQLLEGRALSQDQAAELMNSWLDSEVPDVMSGALLTAIQAKGVDASELAGMARVLRSAALGETLHLPLLVDTCGTGGDGQSTFNISTAVAFVVSAAGIPVAKHGNRAASSKVGSADVLEAIGINLAAPLDKIRAAVDAVGITFLFAPGWHPAMRAVVPYRKTLKIRTIFNLLGPLVNPLGPTAQVIGVYSASVLPTVATALQLLGVRRGVVLHSREGMDEAGLAAPTDLAIVTDDTVEMIALNPADFGISPAPIAALKGGELADNVAILTNVLQGKATQAQQDAVALNAAIALVMAQAVPDWQTGFTTASTLLSSGAAWDKAQALIAFLKN